jgi:hypothetical protein
VPQLGDSYPAVGQAVEQQESRLGDLSLVANQAHLAIAAVDRRLAAVGGPTHLGWSHQTVTWPNLAPNGHPVAETFLPISAGFRAAVGESTGAGSISARPKAQPVAARADGQKQVALQIATGATVFVHAGLVLLVLLQLANQLVATHSRDRQPTEQQEYSLQARLAPLATPPLGWSGRSQGFLQENQATPHSPALQRQRERHLPEQAAWGWHPHPYGAARRVRLAAAQNVVVPVLHCVAPHSPAQPFAAAQKPLAPGYLRLGAPLLVLVKAPKVPQQEQSEQVPMAAHHALVAPMQAHSARSPTLAGVAPMQAHSARSPTLAGLVQVHSALRLQGTPAAPIPPKADPYQQQQRDRQSALVALAASGEYSKQILLVLLVLLAQALSVAWFALVQHPPRLAQSQEWVLVVDQRRALAVLRCSFHQTACAPIPVENELAYR